MKFATKLIVKKRIKIDSMVSRNSCKKCYLSTKCLGLGYHCAFHSKFMNKNDWCGAYMYQSKISKVFDSVANVMGNPFS